MKHVRILGAAALLSAGLLGTSSAVIRPKGAEPPTVTTGRPARVHREIAWARQSMLDNAGFVGWKAIMDRDTGVPLRMWGPNQIASGTLADPALAESFARSFIAAHLDVLAPGAAASDFTLIANQLSPSGDMRSVAFAQHAGGVAVVGGAISFGFKNDRLTLVGSTALPNVTVAAAPARLPESRVTSAASAWLGNDGYTVAPLGAVASERVIVPIVHARGNHGVDVEYTLAEQVMVDSTTDEPGRWLVYVDAATGTAFARKSQLMFASGTVLFDVPVRAPQAAAGRHTVPAPNDVHKVNGTSTTSDASGVVTWTGTAAATVQPGLAGPIVAITNKSGALVTGSLTLPVGGMVSWTQATVEKSDAQLASFSYANQVKAFVKAKLNPTLAYLDQRLSVNVNENDTCNAYSTGDDIHFFIANTQCENTGRMSDVVYHEFGHSMHNNSVIPGVGQFDGSLSEGVADTLAVAILGDSGMGRGFFFNDMPLRELNPTVKKKWPQDADGEPHNEGEIYGETMWDLRQGLQTALGQDAGYTRFLKLYYATVQRGSDIPSTYAEALAADDDDGDLTNGTPDLCAINNAFAAHGLADPSVTIGIAPPTRDGFTVSLNASGGDGANAACPGPALQSVQVDWRVRGTDQLATIDLTANGTTFSGDIPSQADGTVVEYKVRAALSDGSMVIYPDNAADPLYQFYVGGVTKIWCADFESGIGDWTHSATPSTKDDWEAGAPQGLGGDPKTAHGGTGVLGNDLTTDGTYGTRITSSTAASPEIDLMGHTQNVHLQYYRWLGVEDGFYDKATISANGTPVWRNFTSATDPMTAEVNHLDREWRFQDVDVSAQAASGKLKLSFGLTSDPGYQAGGWTIDDVCLVVTGPGAGCGNGQVDLNETCDDGNTVDGDGCSATCQSDDTGGGGGGCCGVGTNPAAPIGLSVFALGLVLRRRRR